MSAMLGMAGKVEHCPHPAELAKRAVLIKGQRGMMAVCHECLAVFKQLIQAWHAYSIRPRTVYARMRRLGYDRSDSVRFLVQLIADRAQVRVGLLKRGAVDV